MIRGLLIDAAAVLLCYLLLRYLGDAGRNLALAVSVGAATVLGALEAH